MGTRHFDISILVFSVTIMTKWHKIVGVITFGAIGIYELLLCANTYVDLKYIMEYSKETA